MTISKRCPDCGEDKPRAEFSKNRAHGDGLSSQCKPCDRARTKDWGKRNKDKLSILSRNKHLKRHYDLTPAQYEEMMQAQGRLCAICEQACGTRAVLSVDHCHTTSAVRGLLCHKCNTGLGAFRDSQRKLSRAQAYLARHLHPSTDKENTDDGGADLRLRGGRLPSGGK